MASCTIHASPETVFQAVINFAEYPRWNSFTPEASCPSLEKGTQGRLYANLPGMKPRRLTEIKISVYSPETQKVAWIANGLPLWLLKPERVQEVVAVEQDGNIQSQFRTYETFAGPLAYIVRWYVGTALDQAAETYVQDLKRWVEQGEDHERPV